MHFIRILRAILRDEIRPLARALNFAFTGG